MRELVLASQSPRRKELLEGAGFAFRILTVEVSEILEKNLTLEDALMSLARRKAKALLESGKLSNSHDFLLLSADTVVVLGEEVLGKPIDAAQAVDFLNKLSGKTHRVITAICLFDSQTKVFVTDLQTTKVVFRKLGADEIREYVASGDPMDKAGAYAIQGEARKFVAEVDGPLDNVVGLPVELVERKMRENGWVVKRR